MLIQFVSYYNVLTADLRADTRDKGSGMALMLAVSDINATPTHINSSRAKHFR